MSIDNINHRTNNLRFGDNLYVRICLILRYTVTPYDH